MNTGIPNQPNRGEDFFFQENQTWSLAASLPKLNTLLLDFDGVFADTELIAWSATGKIVNQERIRASLEPIPIEVMAHEKYVGKNLDSVLRELREESPQATFLTDARIKKLCDRDDRAVIEALENEIKATDGFVEMLGEVLLSNENQKGSGSITKLAIVSSSSGPRLEACLKKLGLFDKFKDHIYSAQTSFLDGIARSKSTNGQANPAIYQLALEKENVDIEHAVAVEDSASGIASAVAAGLMVIGFVGNYPEQEQKEKAQKLKAAGACTVIRDMQELPKVLRKLIGNGLK
jgi:beta-phosphoglucomutase-like phosphatase (HAD superfamily)